MSDMLTIKSVGPSFNYYDWCYNSCDKYFIFDGCNWTGSVETLSDDVDFQKFLKTAPEIRFDVGKYIGYPDFDYLIIPSYNYVRWGGTGNNSCEYVIYALVNNKSILQQVGGLEVWYNIDDGTLFDFDFYYNDDPNESFGSTQSIIVDGKTYTFAGYDSNEWMYIWENVDLEEYLATNNRDPIIGDEAFLLPNWTDFEIEDVVLKEN